MDARGAAAATGTRRRAAAAPATPRTQRAGRRTGLVLGLPATLLLAVAVVARPSDGQDSPWYLWMASGGVVLGVLALVFLRRAWSEPGRPLTALTRWGLRTSAAFFLLWVLGVLLSAVELDRGRPWMGSVLAVGMTAALAATVVIAWRDRPAYPRD